MVSIRRKYQFLQILFVVIALITTAFVSPASAHNLASPAQPNQVQPSPLLNDATVTLGGLGTVFIGDPVTFTVTFDNNGTAEGYGPFIDVILDVTGADGVFPGDTAANAYDGLATNLVVSATYGGQNLTAVLNQFPASGTVNHPYSITGAGALGAPIYEVVSGTPGDLLVSVLLPFGSFVANQPPVTVSFAVSMSTLADLGVPLSVQARGGYRYGLNPLNDFCCGDPSFVGPFINGSVIPSLITLDKTVSAPEGETATGPNFPRTYTINVDVANGQTVADVDVTDTLPNNVQYIGPITVNPAATCTPPSTVTPGGALTCNFAAIGPTGATISFPFYVPLNDSGGTPVIPPTTGDDALSCNTAGALGDWTPADPRDVGGTNNASAGSSGPPCNGEPGEVTLSDKSIAIQKGVANITDANNSPGDILRYTLDFQVSDFFAFQNVTITDVLSDGQRYFQNAANQPTLSLNGNTYALSAAPMDAGNVTVTCNYTGGPGAECDADNPAANDGSTSIVFAVSQETITRGQDGRLVGGCVQFPGGGLVPGCVPGASGDGPTTGTITFYAEVQEDFSDEFPSGDPSVDQGDTLGNTTNINGALLSIADLTTPTGATEDDGSSSQIQIARGSIQKSIYAVNGSTSFTTPVRVQPTDTVTYRITYDMPTSDVENLSFADFFPLPVFRVDDPDANNIAGPAWTLDDTVSAAAPAAGQVKFGPSDTFRAYSGIVPTVTSNTTANSVTVTFGFYDDTRNQATRVDLLFTVTVTDDPFADGLLLTNQATVNEGSTNGGSATVDAIVQITLNEPALTTTKGIVASSNPAAVYNPAAVGPVAFNAPGTAGVRHTGTINSTNLAATPIQSDISNVDAGDVVTFALLVVNSGNSINGAFDLILSDTLHPNFEIPAGGLNLFISYGNPTFNPVGGIPYVGLGGGPDGLAGTADDLFGAGIELVDPPSGDGVCQEHDPVLGNNVIVITYDLRIRQSIAPGSFNNNGTLENYSGTEGGDDFANPDQVDQATVTVALPNLTKSIVATSETHTPETPVLAIPAVRVTIGEIVRYRLVTRMPEVLYSNFQIEDNLPNGITYLDDGTARVAFISNGAGILSTAVGTLPVPALAGGAAGACTLTGSDLSVLTNPLPCVLADGNVGSTNSTDTDPDVYFDNVAPGLDADVDPFFKLGTLDNQDLDDDDEFVVIEFNALVSNNNLNAGERNDLTESDDNNFQVVVGATTVTSNNIRIRTVEPQITNLTKTVTPASGDAGDVVNYTITYSNGANANNNSTAFEVALTDLVSAQLTLNLASINVATACATGIVNNSAGNLVAINFATVPVGCAVTVTYSATILTSVTPGEVLANDADIFYTSLPGDNGTAGNPTGSNNTGAPGTNFGERIGTFPIVLPNDYFDTATVNVTVTAIAPVKSIVSTSDPLTLAENLTIGEVARYRLAVALPESTAAGFVISDTLPAGLTYLNAARLSFLADNPMTVPADLVGADNDALPPTFDIPAGRITQVGQLITFDLGDLVNNDSDADAETVVIEFDVRVDNEVGNQETLLINNVFDVTINGVLRGSNSVDIIVVEPLVTVDKTISALSAEVDAGGTVTYQVVLENPAGRGAPAYDVAFTDALPAVLALNLGSVTITPAGGATGVTNTSAGNTVSLTVDLIPVGGSVTVTYAADILGTATPAQLIANTAEITWTSLAGVDANERTGNDGPGGPLDDYAATDSTQFNIGNPVFSKSLAEPSQAHTTPPDVTIGEVFYYELGVNLPEGTTPALVVTDTLPVGLEFVAGSNALITTTNPVGTCQPTSLAANFSGVVNAPTLNVTAPVAGVHGGILEFVFTSITVPGDNVTNNNAFALCFQAVVTNTAGNQNGAALTNTAEAVSGPWTATPVSVVVDVVEPELQITKSASDTTPALDDTITYTLLVQHTAASSADAFDLLVTDAIPAGLVYVTGSISAPAGWAADAGAAPNLSFTCASPACSLPLGSTASLTYQVQADPANQPALGATLTNNAVLTWTSLPTSVTGERTGGGGVDDYRATTTVDISFAGVSLVLTKDDGGVTAAPGDTIAYTLNVLNDGNADATNVVISDTIPTHTTFNATASTAGWTCAAGFCTFTIPTLAVNASQSVTFAVDVINPLPAGVDEIENTASVRGDHNPLTEPTLVDNTDTEITPVTAGPALEITKDDGLTIVSPGATLTYAILVSNTGNQAATGVVITDTLPTGLTFVSAANGGIHSSGVITWTVGTLPAGSSFSTSLTASVDNPLPAGVTSLTNLAEVSDDGTNTGGVPIVDSTTDTDNLIDLPDANKTLVGSSHTHTATPGAAIGEILTYRVTLSIPPGDLLNLTATDVLDQGLAYVDCTTPVGPNLTTDLPGSWADVCPVAAGDIRPEPSGSAAAVDQARRVIFRFGSVSNATASLQTLTLEYRVVVLNNAANTAINTPSLNNDVLWQWSGGNTSASATPVQVVEPDLEIFKEVDSQVAVNGQVLTFKITVDHTAQSNADAFDVVMADMIPAGLTYVPGSLAYFSGQAPTTLIDATAPMLNVVWDTLLNNGQPSVITFKAVYGGSPVVNTASVAWTSLPGDVTTPQTPNNTLSTERSYDPGDDVNVYGSSSQIGISNPDLPATGFAPGIITDLPQQPENYSYQNLGGIWLEIPGLGVSVPLVGIPLNEAGWDLTWLGNQAGYLEGTAYPSYTGNTAITAHAYLSNGKPGPFANLYTLRWGQKVILHAYGYRYVYEVRRVREVRPDDTSALRHEDRAWLTLITCRYFNEQTGKYGARSLVQAVLVDVQPEQARP